MWEMNDAQMIWWLYFIITLGLAVVGVVLFRDSIRKAIQLQREEHEQKLDALKLSRRLPLFLDTVELDQAAVARYRVFSIEGVSYIGTNNGSSQIHRWAYDVDGRSVFTHITTRTYTKEQLEERHQAFEAQVEEFIRLCQPSVVGHLYFKGHSPITTAYMNGSDRRRNQ